MRIVRFDIIHNVGLKTTPQIEVLKPKEVANVFHFMKNSLEIGNAREDGRHKTNGSDARLVELSHGRDAPLYAHRLVHVGTKSLIKRVDRPRYGDFLHLPEQVKIAQHEVAFSTNEYFCIAVFEFFKQFTCPAERKRPIVAYQL